MSRAWEIWRLVRDVMLVLLGGVIVVCMAFGITPAAAAPSLVLLAGGLFALPGWLRKDERNERRDNGR